MVDAWLYSIASVFAVSLISLVGILTIRMDAERLKKSVFYLVGFAAGALFGDAFIHLLPEAVETFGFGIEISLSILAGIAFSFIVEKFIRWRHCHIPTSEEHPHPMATMNLVGDAVHNFIDGAIIAAGYLASFPVGFATTMAVLFHEIPQEIGDFGVLIHAGVPGKKALFLNFVTALTAIAGAVSVLLLGSLVDKIEFFITPFAAGMFIYIAGSDLIPELHKREENLAKSFFLLLVFCAGIAAMALLLGLEA